MNLAELQSLNNEELYKLGKELGVFENGNMPHRREMMNKVLANLSEKNGNLKATWHSEHPERRLRLSAAERRHCQQFGRLCIAVADSGASACARAMR